MTPEQENKLTSVEFGATADQTGADIMDLLTAHLLSCPDKERLRRFVRAVEAAWDELDDYRQSN